MAKRWLPILALLSPSLFAAFIQIVDILVHVATHQVDTIRILAFGSQLYLYFHRCPFWLFGRKIDGPGLPGGLFIYQGHLFALKGHLCIFHIPGWFCLIDFEGPCDCGCTKQVCTALGA